MHEKISLNKIRGHMNILILQPQVVSIEGRIFRGKKYYLCKYPYFIQSKSIKIITSFVLQLLGCGEGACPICWTCGGTYLQELQLIFNNLIWVVDVQEIKKNLQTFNSTCSLDQYNYQLPALFLHGEKLFLIWDCHEWYCKTKNLYE